MYIDANDLLHTAVHPENAASPKSFKHMMENFLYLVEQQVKIIRPRSQLYIAFDGVAPRAKVTQRLFCQANKWEISGFPAFFF